MINRPCIRLLCVGAGFAGAAFLTGCGHPAAESASKDAPVPALQIVPVTRGDLEQLLPVSGTLAALPGRQVAVSPPVAGVVDGIYVTPGQSVGRGQVIARLSTRQLQGQMQQAQATVGQNLVQVQQAEANAIQQQAQTRIAILQAQAGVRMAQATLAGTQATLIGNEAAVQNARQTLRRANTLLADGLIPQKDVEAAQLALRTAEAQCDAQRQAVNGQRQTVAGQQQAVQAAKAAMLQNLVKRKDVEVARQQVQNARGALATAQAQLSLYTLHAPISGQVTLVGTIAGQTVDTAAKIATIADLSTLQLQLDVPTNTASQVHMGEAVMFKVGGLPGRTLRATLVRLGTQVDTATGTLAAFAVVANLGRHLKDNSTVQASILTEQRRNVLLVPQAAVLTDPDTGKKSVITVGSDSVAHVTPITTGLAARGQVEIQSGVTEGQKVAVSGQYSLADGTKVRVENTSAPMPSAPASSPADAPVSGQGDTHGP